MKKTCKSCSGELQKKTISKEYTVQELIELGEKTNQLKLAESTVEEKDKESSDNKK